MNGTYYLLCSQDFVHFYELKYLNLSQQVRIWLEPLPRTGLSHHYKHCSGIVLYIS